MYGKMNYLILGNGPASIYAIMSIREWDISGSITLVTPEELPAYSPCLLTDLLAGRVKIENLYFTEPDFYKRYNVRTISGEMAVKILTSEKKVLTNSGREIPYDKLLIAIGAEPIVPPIPGVNIKNVFTMKTLQDVKDIQKSLRKIKSVVIIGAGFIGLETAQALRELDKDVTIIEMLDRVLPQMLDAEMAKPIQDALLRQGIKIFLNSKVESINGKRKVKSVTIGKTEHPCDAVIITAGVKPRTTLAREAGLNVENGIIVDKNMRTSDPDIYAAGDVAEEIDIFGNRVVLANWYNATNGGRVAGLNMAGYRKELDDMTTINVVNVAGTPVCSIGNIKSEDTIVIKRNGIWKKYHISEGKIIGIQWLGSTEGAGLIFSLIKKGQSIEKLLRFIGNDTLNYGHILLKS
jgi:NAD(P)H-nitrite reductase large subunit